VLLLENVIKTISNTVRRKAVHLPIGYNYWFNCTWPQRVYRNRNVFVKPTQLCMTTRPAVLATDATDSPAW